MRLTILPLLLLVAVVTPARSQPTTKPAKPNILLLLAEDLGHGDLSCFGQNTLTTPALDALAKDGIRFTQFYAGGSTDTVSRRVLLTGRHVGRLTAPADAARPLAATEPTILSLLKPAGYATAELDDPTTSSDGALKFLADHRARPFLLLVTLGAAPADEELADFARHDWPAPEKRFAARLRNVDRDAARILARLKELDLDKTTLVVFTSLHGPSADGGRNPAFFHSAGRGRGGRGELFEGSIRVPMIARWPGVVPPGAENDRQFWAADLLPTAAELAGLERPADVDGHSLLPALRGEVEKDQWKRKGTLYWESTDGATAQAIRFGKWKAIRSPMPAGPVVLYDMSNDVAEKRDYAQRRPDLLRHATNILDKQRPPAREP